MMTVGGNPFQIARPSRAQRFWPRDWLPGACAMLGAAIFAMGFSSNAWANPSGPLATTVWVANGGAFNAGSLETFAAGASKGTKPLYRNIGPETLLEYFPFAPVPFVGTAPTGVAITPDSPGHVSVVGELINTVLTFTPTANGDTPPETILFGPDTGLGLPSGDAYGPSPFLFVEAPAQPQTLSPHDNELYVANIESGIDGNGAVTEYPEGAGGTSLADPAIDWTPDEAIGGDPTVTFMALPVGVYADEIDAELCDPPAGTPFVEPPFPANYCDNGEIVETVPTRRVWVVQQVLGLVTIYLPEWACDFDPAWCRGATAGLPPYVAQQTPVGGVFPTTTDGVAPPPFGDSADPTQPEFIAVQQQAPSCDVGNGGTFTCPEVYVTDLQGGYHGKGRVKFLRTIPNDICLATDGPFCVFALRAGLYGLPDGTIEGKKTQLRKPMGIAASSASSFSDNLFVTNVDGNSIVQFSSFDRGNVRPDAFVQGRRTKMNQPTGIAVKRPLPLLSSPSEQP